MKSPVKSNEEIIITTDVNDISNLKIKENSYLFNHISKLAADHDVTVSGTMIKVTYKKALKDHFASSTCLNGNILNEDSVFNDRSMSHSVNKSDVYINQDGTEKTVKNKRSMCSSESLTVPKNKKSAFISKEREFSIFHSTPKIDLASAERNKREYINGLNLIVKLENENFNDDSPVNRYHLKPSHAINSHSTTSSNRNLSSKLTPMKESTSEKMQPSSIKLPKGITLIKLEGNSNSKSDKLHNQTQDMKIKEVQKQTIESKVVTKDNQKLKIGVKRKIKIEEDAGANKMIKKRELNSKPKKSSSKSVNFNETVNSVDLSKENLGNNRTGNSKKELLMDDPDLPPGWKRVVHTKYEGTPSEKHVVYIYSPLGKKFQFKWKLRRYLEKTKSTLSAEQFHFGLYKRTKFYAPPKAENERENVSVNTKAQLPKNKAPTASNLCKTTISSKDKEVNLKHSNLVSKAQAKNRLTQCKVKPAFKNIKFAQSSDNEANNDMKKTADADKRQLLLFDPDLPFGWKRIINSNNSSGKLQVHIISPEGRIFRRRYRLSEYLLKHQYTHSLDRFYFGLYPKKDLISNEGDISNGGANSKEMSSSNISAQNGKHDNSGSIKIEPEEEDSEDDDSSSDRDNGSEELMLSEQDVLKFQQYNTPIYDDPKLPDGWKRFIKIRSCGKSAGRMEVVIVSPDGRRHRSKGQLENYLKRNNLSYDADEFDFSVFGRTRKRSQSISDSKELTESFRRRSKPPVPSDRPIPDLEMSSLRDIELTPEGEMISTVSGIMISCQLSSGRSERRLRLPKREHEKLLKSYLDSERDAKTDDSCISPRWIQDLAKCRSDFRNLDPEAALTIAEKTEEFIRELSIRAFQNSDKSEESLRYEDIAKVVDEYECLSPLKTLIPKKITYKDYIKLNRPKQFMSFT